MTRYELEQGLNALYRDIDIINDMDEETACRVYNIDCKADRIEVIQKDIDTYEAILEKENLPSSYELEAIGERYGYDYY